jgi:hypothetical protein
MQTDVGCSNPNGVLHFRQTPDPGGLVVRQIGHAISMLLRE